MKKAFIFAVVILTIFYAGGCASKMLPNTVNSVDDMKGRNIGIVLNSPAAIYADGYGTLHDYTSGEIMLTDLKNGALDCAVLDESLVKPLVSKISGLKTLSQPLIKTDFCFAIAKENPDLTKAVNEALKTLGDNGTLKKIIDAYVSGSSFRYTSPEHADLSAGTLTLALVNDFPPYCYGDGNGSTVGVDVDIAHAVCDILHVRMKLSVLDKSNLTTTVEYGKADFAVGGLTNNENDAKLVDFSDPYANCTQVIVTRK